MSSMKFSRVIPAQEIGARTQAAVTTATLSRRQPEDVTEKMQVSHRRQPVRNCGLLQAGTGGPVS